MSQSTTLNLSIPTKLKKKAKSQAVKYHFSSTSDYLQSLIRNDLEKSQKEKQFEKFISQGLNSGKSEEMSAESLDVWMTEIIDNVK
jgi:Arc/MetJ-type ribon-helix-helix transcriptional regulator